jgi:hypothetical protein
MRRPPPTSAAETARQKRIEQELSTELLAMKLLVQRQPTNRVARDLGVSA